MNDAQYEWYQEYNVYGQFRHQDYYGAVHNADFRTGQSNPNFASRIGRSNVTSPYSRHIVESSFTPANVYVGGIAGDPGMYYRTRGTGAYYVPTAFDLVDVTGFTLAGFDAESRALQKFKEELNAVDVKFQGMTAIGQIHEVWSGMKHPGASLLKGLKTCEEHLGRMARATARRMRNELPLDVANEIRQAIGGTYLEYVFGWAPLIQDIEAGAQALASFTESDTGFVRCRGSATETEILNFEYSDFANVGGCVWGPPVMLHTEHVIRESVQVSYSGSCGRRMSLSNPKYGVTTLGLTMNEFVPTVYELTPYSFVVDYFTNLGDVINDTVRTTPTTLFLSKTVKLERSHRRSGFVTSFGSNNGGTAGSCQTKATSVFRSDITLTGLPRTELELKCPGLSSRKWLNLLALVR